MNDIYISIAEGVLNFVDDKVSKTWEEFVFIMFKMNIKRRMRELGDFADVFSAQKFPNRYMISIGSIATFCNINDSNEIDSTIVEGVECITFNTFRRIVFQNDQLITAFERIDLMYQQFVRYEIEMSSRCKVVTHWALLDYKGRLTKEMSPHVDTRKVKDQTTPFAAMMSTQPRVYKYVTGTYETIVQKLKAKREYSMLRGQTCDLASEIYPLAFPSFEQELDRMILKFNNMDNVNGERPAMMNKKFLLSNENVGFTIAQTLNKIDAERKNAHRFSNENLYSLKYSRGDNFTCERIFRISNGTRFDEYDKIIIGINSVSDSTITNGVLASFSN